MEIGWEAFIGWGSRFLSLPGYSFDREERTYKVRAVEPLQQARAALLADKTWSVPLGKGFTNPSNYLVSHWAFVPFLDWCRDKPDHAASALQHIWAGADSDAEQRLDRFSELLPKQVLPGQGGRCNLGAYLLGAIDPFRWPNYRVTATELAFELTRTPPREEGASVGRRYGHALAFFDELHQRAAEAGLPARDRLDAQGLMWLTVTWDEPKRLSPEVWAAYQEFLSVPSKLHKKAKKSVPSKPLPPPLPPARVCPLSATDDAVRPVAWGGERWTFVCEGCGAHTDPYTF